MASFLELWAPGTSSCVAWETIDLNFLDGVPKTTVEMEHSVSFLVSKVSHTIAFN